MSSRRRSLRALVAAGSVTVTLVTAGCAATGGDDGPDRITYVTAFGTLGRDAFAWVAQERGYFADAGLEVDIQPGSGTGPNLQALTAGQADVAALDLTGALIEAGRGNHQDFQVVAAIHQSTLVAIVSLADSGITAPEDLAGRTLGAGTATVNQLLFPAYARLAGIDETSVTWVNAPPPQLPTLLASGQVDALSTFLISRAGIEAAADQPAVILPYSDYLPDLYGNALIARSSLVEEDPELVGRFRDAMLRALDYTVAHPEEAAEILHAAHPGSSVAAAVGEITMMAPSVTSAGTIGVVDEDRVAEAISLLQEIDVIPPGLTPSDIVAFDLAPTG